MQSFKSRYRKILLKAIAFVLFYFRTFRLINGFINNFQLKKGGEDKLIFPFVKKRQSRNVQILVYHRVNDDKDPFFPAVPTDVFANQMDYISSHYNIFSLEEAIERMKREDVPDNAVVVTFDDGYKDNYLNASPILCKLLIPATIFVATDAIGSKRILWHDRVFSAFRESPMSFLDGFGNRPKGYSLVTLEEKLYAQREILYFLQSLNDRERLFWIDRLVEKLRVTDRKQTPDLMLTWEEIQSMHEGGIFFGAHTVTHSILSKLSTNKAREEIYGAKRILEEKLGIPVKTFAYPNGRREDFNEATKDLLREAGYLCALTTIPGTNETGQDLFELRRATPWDQDIYTFGMRLNYYKFYS